MKKFLVLLLGLFMVFAIVGCDSKDDPTIKFEVENVELNVGDNYELNPVIANLSGSDLVEYSLSQEGIITLDGNKVVAVAVGSVTVNAKLKGYAISAKIEITVKEKGEPVNTPKIKFEVEGIELKIGETFTLAPTVSETSNKVIINYSLSKEGVVTLQDKVITAIAAGEVIVTAKLEGYDVSATLKVTVEENTVVITPSIKFNPDEVEIRIGESYKLNPIVLEASSDLVSYSLSKEGVVSLGTSTIVGLAKGEVVVTAKLEGYDVSATLKVTVKEDPIAEVPEANQGTYIGDIEAKDYYAKVSKSELIITVDQTENKYEIRIDKDNNYYVVDDGTKQVLSFNGELLSFKKITFLKYSGPEIAIIPDEYLGAYTAEIEGTTIKAEIKKNQLIIDVGTGEYYIYLIDDKYIVYNDDLTAAEIVFGDDSFTLAEMEFNRVVELSPAKVPAELQGVYYYNEDEEETYLYVYESKIVSKSGQYESFNRVYISETGNYYVIALNENYLIKFKDNTLISGNAVFNKLDAILPVDNREVASVPEGYQGYYSGEDGQFLDVKEESVKVIFGSASIEVPIITENNKYYASVLGTTVEIKFKDGTIVVNEIIYTKIDFNQLKLKANEILTAFAGKKVELPEGIKVTNIKSNIDIYSIEETEEYIIFESTLTNEEMIAFITGILPKGFSYNENRSFLGYMYWENSETNEAIMYYSFYGQNQIRITHKTNVTFTYQFPEDVNNALGEYYKFPDPIVSKSAMFAGINTSSGCVVLCLNMTENEVMAYATVLEAAGFVYDSEGNYSYNKLFGDVLVSVCFELVDDSVFVEEGINLYYISFTKEEVSGSQDEFPTAKLNDTYPEIALDPLTGTSYDYYFYEYDGNKIGQIVAYGIKDTKKVAEDYIKSLEAKGFELESEGYIFRDATKRISIAINVEYDEVRNTIKLKLEYIPYKEAFFKVMPENVCVEAFKGDDVKYKLYRVNNDFINVYYSDVWSYNYWTYYKYNEQNKNYDEYYYSRGLVWEYIESHTLAELEDQFDCKFVFDNCLDGYTLESSEAAPVVIAGYNCVKYTKEDSSYTYIKYMTSDLKYCMKYSQLYNYYSNHGTTYEVSSITIGGVEFPELPTPFITEFSWPKELIANAIGEVLPDYAGTGSNIDLYNNYNYEITVYDALLTDYNTYLDALESFGYTHITKSYSDLYVKKFDGKRVSITSSYSDWDEDGLIEFELRVLVEDTENTYWPTSKLEQEVGENVIPEFVTLNGNFKSYSGFIYVDYYSTSEFETYVQALLDNGFVKVNGEDTIYVKKYTYGEAEKYCRLECYESYSTCNIRYNVIDVVPWSQDLVNAKIGEWLPKYDALFANYDISTNWIRIANTFKSEMDAYESALIQLGYTKAEVNDENSYILYTLKTEYYIYYIYLTRYESTYVMYIKTKVDVLWPKDQIDKNFPYNNYPKYNSNGTITDMGDNYLYIANTYVSDDAAYIQKLNAAGYTKTDESDSYVEYSYTGECYTYKIKLERNDTNLFIAFTLCPVYSWNDRIIKENLGLTTPLIQYNAQNGYYYQEGTIMYVYGSTQDEYDAYISALEADGFVYYNEMMEFEGYTKIVNGKVLQINTYGYNSEKVTLIFSLLDMPSIVDETKVLGAKYLPTLDGTKIVYFSDRSYNNTYWVETFGYTAEDGAAYITELLDAGFVLDETIGSYVKPLGNSKTLQVSCGYSPDSKSFGIEAHIVDVSVQ